MKLYEPFPDRITVDGQEFRLTPQWISTRLLTTSRRPRPYAGGKKTEAENFS